MNVLVIVPYLHDTAPGQRFRIEQWARALQPHGVHFHFESFESAALKKVLYRPGHLPQKTWLIAKRIMSRVRWLASLDRRRWDAIIVHREILPLGPPILEWLLARTGVPIIYDFDDAIFLPNVSDANKRLAWLKWPQKTATICRVSTHVIAGNEYLRRYAARFTERLSIVPTTIDSDAYRPRPHVALHAPPVVGWSGSLTTIKHLETITAVLQELRRTCAFRLRVIGGEHFSVPGVDVEIVPWQASTEVAHLNELDIGLMPLPDDDWSRGKCGLKALQYMALGIPVVASPVGVNVEIIQDGVNGYLARSHAEWIEKLKSLLVDPSVRERFSREGPKTVERHYSAKVQAPRILELLKAVSRQRDMRSTVAVDATPHV